MGWHHRGHHLPHFVFFSLPEEVKHFYYFALVRSVLFASGWLFMPLYIFENTGSLSLVFLYFAFVIGPFRILSKPLEIYVLRKYGIEFSMFLSNVMAALAFLVAFLFKVDLLSVAAAGLLMGLSAGLYWNAFHTSFGLFGKRREVGEEMGFLVFVQGVISVVVPFLSALLINVLGYHFFYGLVLVFTVVSSLFFLEHLDRAYKVNISLEKVIRSPLKTYHIAEGLVYGFLDIADVFIYIVFGGVVLAFGIVKSVVNLLSSLVSYVVGYLFDKKMPVGLGRLLFVLEGFSGLIMAVFPSKLTVALADFLRQAGLAFHTAVAGVIYLVARRGHPEIVIGRSLYITVGKSLSLLLLFLLSFYLEPDSVFRVGFLLAFLASLVALRLFTHIEELYLKHA